MERTVIFGGSFDPIHNAHIDIIENLSKRFTNVIVMPCKVSPFKTDTLISSNSRYEIICKCISGVYKNAIISDFELESTKPSYTYLSAEYYANQYSNIHIAIGSEMLESLYKWKHFDRLKNIVSFYVIPRPNFPLSGSLLESYADVTMEIADFTGQDISSSEIKILMAMGEIEKFVPSIVAEYFSEMHIVSEYAYVNELYQKYNLTAKRIQHSYSTALCGVSLAKRLDIDIRQAITALLLHDIGKYTDENTASKIGIKLSDECSSMPNPIKHAEIGAEILCQKEGITDHAIIEAVRWHTTAKADMTALEIIVYLADMIEPTRMFDGVQDIRKETEKDIISGFKMALRYSVAHLGDRELYYKTKQAINFYIGE